ncbi:MAG: hypothetical protein M0Z28_10055, partial [Rhodospirillales bacterium]|nr:hypothetical protein [Rhodospirillales bacterium]
MFISILKSLVHDGSLGVIDAGGRFHKVGDGSAPSATCVDGPRGSRWRRREAWGRFDCGHVSGFFVRSMTASP